MKQDLDVTSLDISPGAIKACYKLGLSKTIVGSVSDLNKLEYKYKSFILFGANLGLGGNINGTINMLNSLERISQPNAIIIGSYFEPLPTTKQFHLTYHQKK